MAYEKYKKDRYDRLKKAGMCVWCGNKPATAAAATGRKTIRYCADCRAKSLKSINSARARMKLEVLSHYGKNSTAVCSWQDCPVNDPDMLTIDHIDNSGSEARKRNRAHAGMTLYAILKRTGYPNGYQTLCHNHQRKKELTRRRK